MKRNILLTFAVIAALLFAAIGYLHHKKSKKAEIANTQSIFDYFEVSEEEKAYLLEHSKSQINQDIFVYLELDKKEKGFFVEFGATNGVLFSNSYMLEQQFGWNGILAEPAKVWHKQLKENRPNAIIETLCIYTETGDTVEFNEATSNGLSTINKYSNSDMHAQSRQSGSIYYVETISLLDLLNKYNAPQNIDYLSIDTEGSELDILTSFFANNNYYKIKIITCEHNYTKSQKKLYKLLTKNGYVRKYSLVSKHDDFYVLKK